MKKPFFQLPKDGLVHALTTFLAGVGCVLPLAAALSLSVSWQFIALACAAVTLCFTLLDCMPRLRLLAYPLLFAAVGAMALRYADRAQAISNALTLFLSGQPLALAAYSRAAALLLCLLFTGLAASLDASGQAFFPLAFLCIAVLFITSFLGADVSAVMLLPLLCALLLSARGTSVSSLRIIPIAAVVLGVTMLFMPMAGQTNDALAAFARKARQAIGDYLFFTDPRTTFSLSATGWQPLGPDQLGGPVSPTDDPVMQVYTTGRTLLRGTVKNTYTGNAWSDTTDQRRYLFVNPRFAALRRDLFDLVRPEQSVRNSVLVTEPMIVSMRASSASTLYLTQRFTSPTGEGIVAYFSPSTEVFATRSLEAGSRYTFTGSRLTGASEGARNAVLISQTQSDPYLSIVRERYLSLPSGIDQQVFFLAQQIAAQADNDFDRAAALCSYLQQSFPYTLAQNMPPIGSDFVSWFLFDEQQGYCTSFASALAVMGRAVGLPTRYVEGYAAEPDSDNIARVTQENAHAWVEIYFAGFGWLPFDPTPGTGFVPDGTGDHPAQHDPDDQGEEEDSASPDVTPTPEATPSPTPTATAQPTPTPSPTPEHNDPQITPTPEITPAPTPQPTPEPTASPTAPPDSRDNEPPVPPYWLLLIVFAMLLLAALIALRLYLTSPAYLVSRMRRANDQLLVWYRACEQALLCLGVPPHTGEGPASYVERAQEQLGKEPELSGLGKAVCIARYSPYKLSRTQVDRAQKTYRALLGRLTLLMKLRLYARRLIKGIRL